MDWRVIRNDREKYAAYLCSREWAEKRETVRRRCGGICERCKCFPMEACHHLTYLRKYRELLSDLQGICNYCHEFTHGKSGFDQVAAVAILKAMERHKLTFNQLYDVWKHLNTDISSIMEHAWTPDWP